MSIPGLHPRTTINASGSEVMVRLEGVSRVYGRGEVAVRALDGIDLEIPRGQFVALLGPSGSGKTTLLNLIGGIDTATGGHLRVDGVNLVGLDRSGRTDFRRDHIGFVFQFFNLIPTLTAVENVELIAALTGGRTEEAARALEAVGLAGELDRFPSQLSGGQQQRVAIARALAKDAPVLLCDEPTGALDRHTGAQVLELLERVNRDRDRTVIMVTHDPEAARVADRVIHLVDGHIHSDTANRAEAPVDPDEEARPHPGGAAGGSGEPGVGEGTQR